MTTVWVLTAVCYTSQFIGPTLIHVDTLVFKSAARCVRNIDNVKTHLEKEYGQVVVQCVEKDLNEDKK